MFFQPTAADFARQYTKFSPDYAVEVACDLIPATVLKQEITFDGSGGVTNLELTYDSAVVAKASESSKKDGLIMFGNEEVYLPVVSKLVAAPEFARFLDKNLPKRVEGKEEGIARCNIITGMLLLQAEIVSTGKKLDDLGTLSFLSHADEMWYIDVERIKENRDEYNNSKAVKRMREEFAELFKQAPVNDNTKLAVRLIGNGVALLKNEGIDSPAVEFLPAALTQFDRGVQIT